MGEGHVAAGRLMSSHPPRTDLSPSSRPGRAHCPLTPSQGHTRSPRAGACVATEDGVREAGMEKLLSDPWKPDLETGSRPAVPLVGQRGAGCGWGVGEGPAHWSPPSRELVLRGKQRLRTAYAPGISILDGHWAPAKENMAVPGRPGTSFHRQSRGAGRSRHRSPAPWDGRFPRCPPPADSPLPSPQEACPQQGLWEEGRPGCRGQASGGPAGVKPCSFSLGGAPSPSCTEF